jgi:hypothetical protein
LLTKSRRSSSVHFDRGLICAAINNAVGSTEPQIAQVPVSLLPKRYSRKNDCSRRRRTLTFSSSLSNCASFDWIS